MLMLQQEWLVTECSGSMLPHVTLCIKYFPFQILLLVAIHNTWVSNLNEVAFVNRLSATQQLVTAVLSYQAKAATNGKSESLGNNIENTAAVLTVNKSKNVCGQILRQVGSCCAVALLMKVSGPYESCNTRITKNSYTVL